VKLDEISFWLGFWFGVLLCVPVVFFQGCGPNAQSPQDRYIKTRAMTWQLEEPEAVERTAGIRPTMAELKAFCLSWSSEWTNEDTQGHWPTHAEVEAAGNRSNCVGLSHHAFRKIRDAFNISDADLWIVVYWHRDDFHTVLSVETADGHYWYDRSFGEHGIWYQGEKTVLWKYNLFDVGTG
jgi:hypothetical protein